MVSGYAELPFWRGKIPNKPPFAALVDFYDAQFRDQDVRVAVLLQPVASAQGRGMAVIQVAETLELRHALTRQILWNTLQRVQENVIRGGLAGRSAQGRKLQTRPVASIDRGVSLNRALWTLAEEMRKIKA